MRLMQRFFIVILSIGFVFAVQASSCHEDGGSVSNATHKPAAKAKEEVKQPPLQTLCPVMGNVVDRRLSVTWEGNEDYSAKRIYFCCSGCIATFNKDPEKYVKKLYKMKQFVEAVEAKKVSSAEEASEK